MFVHVCEMGEVNGSHFTPKSNTGLSHLKAKGRHYWRYACHRASYR